MLHDSILLLPLAPAPGCFPLSFLLFRFYSGSCLHNLSISYEGMCDCASLPPDRKGLALPPDRKGLSRLWVPLFGVIFPLNFVFCRGTFPVLLINSSGLSSLAEPAGLGAPLSSYLEGALYKVIYR